MTPTIRRLMMLAESYSRKTSQPKPLLENDEATYDAAAKQLLGNIDWSSAEQVYAEAGIALDDDGNEDHSELDDNDPTAKAKLATWARTKVENASYTIDECFEGDHITVWREITAPKNWKPDPKRHPGEYWSWSERAAEAHWGSFANGDVKWLLTAIVSRNDIDWVTTLAANSDPDTGEDECEIKLLDGVTPKFTYARR